MASFSFKGGVGVSEKREEPLHQILVVITVEGTERYVLLAVGRRRADNRATYTVGRHFHWN